MFEDAGYYQRLPLELEAALEEMRFWLRIMADHAKLIRNGFDLMEERFFRVSDRFSLDFDELLRQVQAPSPGPPEVVGLMNKSEYLTGKFRDFKASLVELINNCRVLSNRPGELIDHLRREAEYFLGKMRRIQGRPTPTREEIGIPDGNLPTFLVPRLLIPSFQDHLKEISIEENLFWLHQHSEHAGVLGIYLRPVVQRELLREVREWERRLESELRRVERMPVSPEGIKRVNEGIGRLVRQWQEYLEELFAKISRCQVPTGQVNFPPSLADHMAREAVYHLSLLEAINEKLH
ncbi:MAG TPA: DUF2935 domain-containing protein [Clostridia bacterium]|jgi:hypothetical protein|nr:DUF2935 domain-containing protein [Clostridia bacterium]